MRIPSLIAFQSFYFFEILQQSERMSRDTTSIFRNQMQTFKKH